MGILVTRILGGSLFIFSISHVDADVGSPLEVMMIDRNGDRVMMFKHGEFSFNLRYARDPHVDHTYLICGEYHDFSCAIDYDGIAFPYVVDERQLSCGDTWQFDGSTFEIIREYMEPPKRFASCAQVFWVRADTGTYSHRFAYSSSCGVIGGCFNWRDSEIFYWSSEANGLSLDPRDYRLQDLLAYEQVKALHYGLLKSEAKESFAIRGKCLDDRTSCPKD